MIKGTWNSRPIKGDDNKTGIYSKRSKDEPLAIVNSSPEVVRLIEIAPEMAELVRRVRRMSVESDDPKMKALGRSARELMDKM